MSVRRSRRDSTEVLANALGIDFSASPIVRIDSEKLELLCEHIQRRTDFTEYDGEKWDDPLFYAPGHSPMERTQFFAIGNAINFRYWEKTDRGVVRADGVKKGQRFLGAMYMWRSLQVALDEGRHPILDANFLSNLTADDFGAIFSDDNGRNPLSIAHEDRIENLRDLGSILQAKWAGQFLNLVKATHGSLLSFARLSRACRAYDDPCYKLTMVNAILLSGSGLADWDAEPLPGIDYHLLKQLIRIGVLLPARDVARKLEQQQLLSQTEAYDLRRMALGAFASISSRTGLSGELLDNKFFMNRRKCDDAQPVCLNERTAAECPFFGPCTRQLAYTTPLELTRYY